MGRAADKNRSVREELEAVPAHRVAEILAGVLHVQPRPATPHAAAASALGIKLGGPFQFGDGGPGGWHILDEPELHFGPEPDPDILVPDLAGWRVERLPRLPRTATIPVVPDWVCEVLSASTESVDRTAKLPIYAREGVRHTWLLHPLRRTLEVLALNDDHRWTLVAVYGGAVRVRAEPFSEIELDLTVLWPADDLGPEDEDLPAPAITATKKRKLKDKPKRR